MSSKGDSNSTSKVEQIKQAIVEQHATDSIIGSVTGITVVDDDDVEQKDQRVELVRDIAQMVTATGQFKELIFQVTNLDHPVHAMSVVHDGTEIEILRSMGLSKILYDTYIGIDTPMSGLGGHMKARMGIMYPGIGADSHPRNILGAGISGAPRESKQSKGLRDRLDSIMSG